MSGCARALLLGALFALLLSLPRPVCAQGASRAPEQFHHSNWTIEDGAPPDIWAIAQTADGFLWLGTGGGLYRFDGIRFEEIRPRIGKLPSRNITALLATDDGDLWLGSYDGQIARLRNGRLTGFGAANDSVDRFTRGPDGTVWAGFWRGPRHLARFDGAHWRWIPNDSRVVPGKLGTLIAARDGTVWASTERQILRLRPGDTALTPVAWAQPGDRLVGTRSGGVAILHTGAPRTGTTFDQQAKLGLPAFWLPGGTPEIKRALIDRQGTLWWTGGKGGVSRLLPPADGTTARVEQWEDRQGLSANAAVPVFEDREGAIWVGTNLGLDRFRRARVVRADAFGPSPYKAYLQTVLADGTIYVVTRTQTLTRAARDGSLSPVLHLASPPAAIAADGNRLIVEQSGHLFVLHRDRLVPLGLPVLPGRMATWSRDKDGTPTITVRGQGVLQPVQGGWRMLRITGVPTLDRKLEIPFTGPVGRWFYADDRLIGCARGVCTPISRGVDVGRINIVMPGETEQGAVLIGGDSGLAIGRGDRFESLTSDRFPVLVGITGIARGAGDIVWLSGLRGVVQTTQAALARTLSSGRPLAYRLFTMADGVPGAAQQDASYSTALRGGDGRIWLAASHGIAWIDPNRLKPNPAAPPVLIRSVSADGREVALAPNIAIAAGTRRIQIDYAALSLLDPDRVQFRYRLSGVDEAWVDPGQRRQATYTNVAPGRWTFQVIAANADGVWNTRGASIELTVAPTFYQTWLFRVAVAAIAGMMLAGLYRIRKRAIEERTRRLIAAQVAERERIARELHDTLLQGMQAMMLRFQAVGNILAPDSRAHDMLESALERGDDVLLEGRDRVRNLRPENRTTLQSALHAIAGQIGDGLTIEIVEQGLPRTLCDPVIDELAAIAREALTNTLWHAQATHATVALDFTRWSVRMSVRDNGRGFSARILEQGAKPGHFGLPGMRERAAKLAAVLTLSNRDGGGAEVVITVPARIAYARPRSVLQRATDTAAAWLARLRGRSGGNPLS
jgi:signal transduction histidine kinase